MRSALSLALEISHTEGIFSPGKAAKNDIKNLSVEAGLHKKFLPGMVFIREMVD